VSFGNEADSSSTAGQQPVVLTFDNPIALTTRLFESPPIEDVNTTSCVADQTRFG